MSDHTRLACSVEGIKTQMHDLHVAVSARVMRGHLSVMGACAGRQVVQCRREEMRTRLGRADMAVPLMSRIDAPDLDAAPRLKCVLQYGVGVEGINIPAVSFPPAPLALSVQDGVLVALKRDRSMVVAEARLPLLAGSAQTCLPHSVLRAGWLSCICRFLTRLDDHKGGCITRESITGRPRRC